MIETTKQTIEALEEIKRLTEWTNRRLATKIGVPGSTVHRIINNGSTPNLSTMGKVDVELRRVRRLHGGK